MTSLRKSLAALRTGEKIEIRNYKNDYVRKVVSIMNAERPSNAGYLLSTESASDGGTVVRRGSVRRLVSVHLSDEAYEAAANYARLRGMTVEHAVGDLIVAGLGASIEAPAR